MSHKQPNTSMPFRVFVQALVYFLLFLPAVVQANAVTSTNQVGFTGFTLHADNQPIEVKKFTITPHNTPAVPNNITLMDSFGKAVNKANNAFTLTPSDSESQSQTVTINAEQAGQSKSADTISIKQMKEAKGECNNGVCFINNVDVPLPETVPQSEAQEQVAPSPQTEFDMVEPLNDKANDSEPREKETINIQAQAFNKKEDDKMPKPPDMQTDIQVPTINVETTSNLDISQKQNEKVPESAPNENVSPSNFNLAEQTKETEPEPQPIVVAQEDLIIPESTGKIDEPNGIEKTESIIHETKEEPIQRIFRKINSFFKRMFSFFGRK